MGFSCKSLPWQLAVHNWAIVLWAEGARGRGVQKTKDGEEKEVDQLVNRKKRRRQKRGRGMERGNNGRGGNELYLQILFPQTVLLPLVYFDPIRTVAPSASLDGNYGEGKQNFLPMWRIPLYFVEKSEKPLKQMEEGLNPQH